jgi:hypothetical protein
MVQQICLYALLKISPLPALTTDDHVAGDSTLFPSPARMGRVDRRSLQQLKWIKIQSKISAQHFTYYV